jgi:thymidylate kinase
VTYLITGIQAAGKTTVVDLLDRGLRDDTPRLGLWLDTSDHTVDRTVEEILRRSSEALVADEPAPARDGAGFTTGERPPGG